MPAYRLVQVLTPGAESTSGKVRGRPSQARATIPAARRLPRSQLPTGSPSASRPKAIANNRATEAETIYYSCGKCYLGTVLVARSSKGVCGIFLGDKEDVLASDLHKRFASHRIVDANAPAQPGHPLAVATLLQVMKRIEDPATASSSSSSSSSSSTLGNDQGDDLDDELALDLRGTLFQQRVWAALRTIPAGKTESYTELARRAGVPPTSVRAVAQACGANPLAILVPCHRITRSDGGISGYRWGVERKRQLLRKEGALV